MAKKKDKVVALPVMDEYLYERSNDMIGEAVGKIMSIEATLNAQVRFLAEQYRAMYTALKEYGVEWDKDMRNPAFAAKKAKEGEESKDDKKGKGI